jgi:hypothetical protein
LSSSGGEGVVSTELDASGLLGHLRSGRLHPTHKGRFYVALSLAEAETLRLGFAFTDGERVVEARREPGAGDVEDHPENAFDVLIDHAIGLEKHKSQWV